MCEPSTLYRGGVVWSRQTCLAGTLGTRRFGVVPLGARRSSGWMARTGTLLAVLIVLPCADTSAPDAPRTEDLLLTRLQRIDSLRLQWRAKAGALWCKHVNQKVGPTGGFCLSASAPNFGGNQFWSRPLGKALAQLFQSKVSVLPQSLATRKVSVLDLGCGLGHYGKYLKAHAPGVEWVGLDGSEGIEEATRGLVRFADLDSGMPESVTRRPWDWVMSLEVGEHIPRGGEPYFMHGLASLAREGIVLSWATKSHQNGLHVNMQDNDYVRCAASLLGWKHDDAAGVALRESVLDIDRPEHAPWFRKTLMAFRPVKYDAAPSSGLLPLPLLEPSAEWVRAYLDATKRKCNYTWRGTGSAAPLAAGARWGTCAATSFSPHGHRPMCKAGGAASGAWHARAEGINTLGECAERCRAQMPSCCGFVSFSETQDDCSWFKECDLDDLKESSSAGLVRARRNSAFQTMRVGGQLP